MERIGIIYKVFVVDDVVFVSQLLDNLLKRIGL